jgi:hypothetical protein
LERVRPSGFREISLSIALLTDVEPAAGSETGKMNCQWLGGSLETIPIGFHFELEQAVLNNYSEFCYPIRIIIPHSGNINVYFPP